MRKGKLSLVIPLLLIALIAGKNSGLFDHGEAGDPAKITKQAKSLFKQKDASADKAKQTPARKKRKQGSPNGKVQLFIPGLGKQSSDPEDCITVRRVVPVTLDTQRYPETSKHVKQAISKGHAKILHIDREGADENRDLSLAGIPTKPEHDRDEYPPASSYEGGEGASVKYVPYADNRGAGSSMGAQLSDYCSGQPFKFVFAP